MARRSISLLNSLYRIRAPLALLGFILLLFALYFCSKLRVDNSLSVWFNKGDPAIESYDEFCSEFGSDEIILTMLSDDTEASEISRLSEISYITRDINLLEGVSYAASITNIPFINDGSDLRAFDYYLERYASQHIIDSLFGVAKNYRSFNRFLGKEGKSSIILTWAKPYTENEELRGEVIRKVDSIAKSNTAADISHGGTGVIYDSLNSTTISESMKFVTLSYLIVIILIALFTRRWIWVLLTLLVISSANIVLFGIMGLSATPVNMVTMAIPPLIMVIGVAIIMHISRHLSSGDASTYKFPSTPVVYMSFLMLPLLYNAVTTSGGFLSLATGSMAITRNYGLFAAIGVVLVFLFALLYTLLFLKILSVPQPTRKQSPLFVKVALEAFRFASKRRYLVLSLAILMVVFALPGILKVNIDTNTIEFLPGEHRVRIDNRKIEENYGGYIPLDFLLTLPDGVDPDYSFFTSVLDWQNDVCSSDSIDAAFSLADIVGDLSRISGEEGVKLVLPALIYQNANDKVKNLRLVSSDRKSFRVSFFGPSCSAAALVGLAGEIESKAAGYLGDKIEITRSGYLPLYSEIIGQTLNDQLKSFGLALIVIILLMGLLLKSVRYTLISIPSNLIPVLLVLAFMGYLKIPLDIGTVTIAATVLGIIVDDSIHILYHFRKYRSEGSLSEALEKTASISGSAIIYSTIALSLGFAVLAFAGISTLANSGILISAAIFFALITDLLLIPSLLVLLDRK